MGQGIDWMIAVALWVDELSRRARPRRRLRHWAPAAGDRWSAGARPVQDAVAVRAAPLFIGVAAFLMGGAPQPDVMVAADGSAVAVRGRMAGWPWCKSGSDMFAMREWLAADADARNAERPDAGRGHALRRAWLHRPARRRPPVVDVAVRSTPSRRIAAAPRSSVAASAAPAAPPVIDRHVLASLAERALRRETAS